MKVFLVVGGEYTSDIISVHKSLECAVKAAEIEMDSFPKTIQWKPDPEVGLLWVGGVQNANLFIEILERDLEE